MVVGGGLEEDVCKNERDLVYVQETRDQPGPDDDKEGMAPHPVPLTVGKQDPVPFP